MMGCSGEPDCNVDLDTPESLAALVAANTPEALIIASGLAEFQQVENPDTSRLEADFYRDKALKLAPNDEWVLSYLNNECSPSNPEEDSPFCSQISAMRLVDLSPENGFRWANLAHYQLSDDDAEAALASYQRAAAAPTFSIGWGPHVFRLTTALQETFQTEEFCAVVTSAGMAAAKLPSYQEFTNTCRARTEDAAWRDACINLGQKMETQATTLISRMIGFSLQRIVYEAIEDDDGVAAVAARKEDLQAMVQQQSSVYECLREHADWVHRWLISVRDFGEMESLRRLSEGRSHC
ncbi:MAG: hypothetical protein AAF756_02115 [Pseudomonadota bacterium]